MKQLSVLILLIIFLFSCNEKSTPSTGSNLFADTPMSTRIVGGVIDEASGLADSRANPGFLWVEQDSGNPPELALLGHNGTHNKKIYIKGALNRDWEDMALAMGPAADINYIYVADIGDNNLQYNTYFIYRFPEPAVSTDTVQAWDQLAFQYPDGPHNAEAIFVDNVSKDIFIITKNDAKSKIFKLSYPQNTVATILASFVGELPFGEAVGAAISADSREIIIKTYTSLHYWAKQSNESFEVTLKKAPSGLPYKLEIQGEAVCFKKDNSGIFTLSEKPSQIGFVELNYYKRN